MLLKNHKKIIYRIVLHLIKQKNKHHEALLQIQKRMNDGKLNDGKMNDGKLNDGKMNDGKVNGFHGIIDQCFPKV